MMRIDLNCDLGEFFEMIADGRQEALMQQITSANVACGGHAGDEETMATTIEQAKRFGVSIGAHPGYADKANFGRNELKLGPEEISESVYRQIRALAAIAARYQVRIAHVKPHGALYNQAAKERSVARSIADGVRSWRHDVILVGLAGSVMLEEFRGAGFAIAAEAFADRRYEDDGSLRSRKFSDALLQTPGEAAGQALRIVTGGSVIATSGQIVPLEAQTICLHGDTPGAVDYAIAIRKALREAGVALRALG